MGICQLANGNPPGVREKLQLLSLLPPKGIKFVETERRGIIL